MRAFENRALRNSCGFKGDEVAGDWKRGHHDKLYHLYSSPNIILVMKSRRIRWTGVVARMADRGCAYRISAGGGLIAGDHFEGLGVDGSIILK